MGMGFSAYYQAGQSAVAYVASKMTLGADNQSPTSSVAQNEATQCINYVRSLTHQQDADGFVDPLSANASKWGCGRCGEQAAMAFTYLARRGYAPLDYRNLIDASGTSVHSFVMLGRDQSGTAGDDSSWGDEAVICDPWDSGRVYTANQIGMRMSLWSDGCFTESYNHPEANVSR